MHITGIPTSPTAEARLLRWLALAALLHAALLLWPPGDFDRGSGTTTALTVSLLTPLRSAPQRDIPQPRPAIHPAPPAEPAPRPPPTIPESPTVAPGVDAAIEHRGAADHALSAARLIELAREREWSLPETSRDRNLGVLVPRARPDNWRSPKARWETRFDGRALPDGLEIVDRWLAADGSHNMRVETPGGEVLCGRAEAWDPLRPLVENVVMFRTCGPGTRTFEWPERYRDRSARSPEPLRPR